MHRNNPAITPLPHSMSLANPREVKSSPIQYVEALHERLKQIDKMMNGVLVGSGFSLFNSLWESNRNKKIEEQAKIANKALSNFQNCAPDEKEIPKTLKISIAKAIHLVKTVEESANNPKKMIRAQAKKTVIDLCNTTKDALQKYMPLEHRRTPTPTSTTK